MVNLSPLSNPATPDELLRMLDEMGFQTKTHTHEAVFTVEESERVTASISGAHTKNLFVKDKKGKFFLIVAGNRVRISLNRIHGLIGASGRVSFANEASLMHLLGVKPGSVNAFAPVNDRENQVSVVIDAPLLEHEMINCHPLINEMTTTISREDLLHFLTHVNHEPLIVRVSEEEEVL